MEKISSYKYLSFVTLLLCVALAMVLLLLMPLQEERVRLQRATASAEARLLRLEQFASRHKDYDEAINVRRQRLRQAGGLLLLPPQEQQRQLTQSIAEAGLRLLKIRSTEGGTVQLQLTGGFYNILRAIRKMEREGVKITSLKISRSKAASDDNVLDARLELKLFALPLGKD